ncbi:MAG: hypothetical protein ACR2ML_09890 [Solirubrobacteraceae bacterium]
MRRWESLAIALLLVAAAAATLAACGDGGDGPPAGGGAGIEYVRTGGLANVGERLKIDAGGRATLQIGGDAGPPRRFNVPGQEAEGVRRALDDAGFADLPTVEERTIPEPDGFNYAIRYRDHLVRREQAGLDPRLGRAIRRLDKIVSAYRS